MPEDFKSQIDSIQRDNVAKLYDEMAQKYDEEFESKADYQVPPILLEIYERCGINGGSVLDVGSGTGKLKRYLGESFEYKGIDISPNMAQEARNRGYEVIVGAAEEVLENMPDKSVDNVVALSSLYFIKDFPKLVAQFERIARKSVFMTLEQFTPEIVEFMKGQGIQLYNHDASLIIIPTETTKNIYLWKRPVTGEKVFGDIVFKKIQ